jgi:hypothetical protein
MTMNLIDQDLHETESRFTADPSPRSGVRYPSRRTSIASIVEPVFVIPLLLGAFGIVLGVVATTLAPITAIEPAI